MLYFLAKVEVKPSTGTFNIVDETRITVKSSSQMDAVDQSNIFERLSLPILEGPTELLYKESKTGEIKSKIDSDKPFIQIGSLEKCGDIAREGICRTSVAPIQSMENRENFDNNCSLLQVQEEENVVPVYEDTGTGYHNDRPLNFLVLDSNSKNGLSGSETLTFQAQQSKKFNANNSRFESSELQSDRQNLQNIPIVDYSSSEESNSDGEDA